MNQAQVVQSIVIDFKHTTKHNMYGICRTCVWKLYFFFYKDFFFFNTRHSGVKTGNTMSHCFSPNSPGCKVNLCFCPIQVHLIVTLPSCTYWAFLLLFHCSERDETVCPKSWLGTRKRTLSQPPWGQSKALSQGCKEESGSHAPHFMKYKIFQFLGANMAAYYHKYAARKGKLW